MNASGSCDGAVLCITVWFKFAARGLGDPPHHRLFIAGSLAIRRHYRTAQESIAAWTTCSSRFPGDGPCGAGADGATAGIYGGHHGSPGTTVSGNARLLSVVKQFPGCSGTFVSSPRDRRTERVKEQRRSRTWRTTPGAARKVRGVVKGHGYMRRHASCGDRCDRVHHPT